MSSADPISVFNDYATMIDAFRAAKELRGLSNNHTDELANLATGHTDAILGPTGRKTFGRLSFDALAWAFCVKFVMIPDVEREAEMAEHWVDRQRQKSHVRTDTHRMSKVLIERAKPLVFKEMSKLATIGRKQIPREQRVKIARKAIVTRWRRKRKMEREAKAVATSQSQTRKEG